LVVINKLLLKKISMEGLKVHKKYTYLQRFFNGLCLSDMIENIKYNSLYNKKLVIFKTGKGHL